MHQNKTKISYCQLQHSDVHWATGQHKANGKAILALAYYRPLGFQEVGAFRFLDNWHMKIVSFSALRTGRL